MYSMCFKMDIFQLTFRTELVQLLKVSVRTEIRNSSRKFQCSTETTCKPDTLNLDRGKKTECFHFWQGAKLFQSVPITRNI